MRISTFNIFWLGTPEHERIRRGREDEALVARVIANLDADAIVFQEIVSMPLCESILAAAGAARGRSYSLRDAEGHYLTTGRVRSRTSHLQKLALAYDKNTLDLTALLHPFTDRSWPGPRAPIAARLKHRASGFDFTLAGVHLKSGEPGEPADAPPAVVRASECAALATWLLGGSRHEGGKGGPPTDAVILTGDLNAVREHPSLHPLFRLLPAWTWHRPIFHPDDGHQHWTSYSNRTVIDHVLSSPAATARIHHAPHVYAFDLDPVLAREPDEAGPPWMHRKTDLEVRPDEDKPAETAPNLFRVSDHRPVSIDLDV